MRKDLWFQSTKYNMVRVINALADLVEAKGGTVERQKEERLIHTRGYAEEIDSLKTRYERVRRAMIGMHPGDPAYDTRAKALEEIRKKLSDTEEMENNSPVITTYFCGIIPDAWIDFTLDGYGYYFAPDSNPYFPDKYIKRPLGKDERGYYLEEIEAENKCYMPDSMFTPVAPEDEIKAAAKELLAYLTSREVMPVVKR